MSNPITLDVFKQGLSRLAENLRLVDYHRSNMEYAKQFEGKGLSLQERSKLPEVIQWRRFIEDVAAELNAAFEIGGQSFRSRLPHCCRLAVTIEEGHLPSYKSPLVVEAITEIKIVLLELSVGDDDALVEVAAGDLRYKGDTLTNACEDPNEPGIRRKLKPGHESKAAKDRRYFYFVRSDKLDVYVQRKNIEKYRTRK
ncbi:hypothetical protein [Rhodopirellula europaea]|uniref:hypothetical protein n=1 Tax=Rhodopirellula europaea TaxID=1263866 RepID=UPI003D2967E2